MTHPIHGAVASLIALIVVLPAAAQGPVRGDLYFSVGSAGIDSDIADSAAPPVSVHND